ncbi:hypothetical protein DSO57_1021013 [Entomophthora muscae]|uniref:Uncharacterized protein n=1 Tax=Entomophthora muscae TaxID=34485 RepID=A0ACC2S5K3_9FUNG|nr:hypothetical protein DSO57_1021013 [Entomophthora muscae]
MVRNSIAIGISLVMMLGSASAAPVKAASSPKGLSRPHESSKAPRVVFVRRAVDTDRILTDVDGEPNTVIVHRDTMPLLTLLEKAIPF